MGVISRRVLPICGNICCFCPSLRARPRQPVKRYKKLLADIFPRSQDTGPNDRMIGKLCEYASKNPLRIPKITEYLEQRFYKELRNEHLGSVKVVLHIHRKLLSTCKEQMNLEDIRLQAVCVQPGHEKNGYGSQEDEVAALKSLSAVEFGDQELKATIITYFMTTCTHLSEVLETARHVASSPISSTPIPYDEVTNQCEALVTGKQQKMSALQSLKLQQEAKEIYFPNDTEKKSPFLGNGTTELLDLDTRLTNMEQPDHKREFGQQQSIRLPPSSPYDKFLKAAGC